MVPSWLLAVGFIYEHDMTRDTELSQVSKISNLLICTATPAAPVVATFLSLLVQIHICCIDDQLASMQ
jgi:hypothetical protein